MAILGTLAHLSLFVLIFLIPQLGKGHIKTNKGI
jgi:hypothetical protein